MKNPTQIIIVLGSMLLLPCQAEEKDMPLPVGAKNIFKKLDSNKDQTLDKFELESTGPKNLQNLTKQYDDNADGKITLSEMGLTPDDLKEKVEPKKPSGKKKKGKKKRRRK